MNSVLLILHLVKEISRIKINNGSYPGLIDGYLNQLLEVPSMQILQLKFALLVSVISQLNQAACTDPTVIITHRDKLTLKMISVTFPVIYQR